MVSLAAACTATNAPRLDPTRATGAFACSMAASVCWSIRVTVNVSNAGWLKSGHANGIFLTANSRWKRVALDDAGEDANPCR